MKGPGESKQLFRLTECRRHVEEEVDDELHFHMEGLAERFRAQGMDEEQAWEAAMEELAALAEEHGFRPVLITFSVTFAHRQQRILEFARQLGIDSLVVGETFNQYLDEIGHDDYRTSPLALSDENMHPSVLGHRIAARLIYRWLCEQQFSAELASCEVAPWDAAETAPATAAGS